MHLANHGEISNQHERNENGRKGNTTFIRNTASVLTLPRLSQKIQTQFNAGGDLCNLAGLALNLMKKGYVEENETEDLTKIISNGFQKWVLAHAGDLKHFDFTIELTPDLSNISNLMADEDFAEVERGLKEAAGKSPMFFLIEPGYLGSYAIGQKLKEIEDKVTGLGKTAYYWLATCGAKNTEIYTPWMGSSKAQHIWWYGEDNQDDFVEAVQSYYDEEDAIESALEVSPDSWRAAFPSWVTSIEKALSEDELKVIAQERTDSLESKVAAILLEMIQNKDATIPDARSVSLEPMHNGMYLFWTEHDMSSQLIDDWFQEINQMGGEGFVESLCVSPIPTKTKQFNEWMSEMEKGFNQLRNIEQLIELIGTRLN
jgi:PRTRC genetic system protein F